MDTTPGMMSDSNLDRSLRTRLDDLKFRGLRKMNETRQLALCKAKETRDLVTTRSTAVRRSVRDGVSGQMERMQSSMRTSPAKWTGIAAGSGLAIGLIGRLFHARKHHRHMPTLVVIETVRQGNEL